MVTARIGNVSGALFAAKYKEMLGAAFFGKDLVVTPVTKTTSNITGDETLTEGTSVTVKGSLYKASDKYAQDNPGLIKDADAVVTFPPGTSIAKDYKITWNSENFRVDDTEEQAFGKTNIYIICRVYII